MGWLGRKRKPHEETVEELPNEPLTPLPPVLNLLIPDIAGATSFHLRQFYSTEEARDYIETLPSASGLHAFWGLHEPPAGHVSGEGTGEAMVLIRSAEVSDTVYVVSFVDLDSAVAFARFEAKRGMSPGLLLIYWAELVNIEAGVSGVRLSPETPPPPARRFAGIQAAASTGASESAPSALSQALETRAAIAEPQPVVKAEPEPRTGEPAPVVEAEPELVRPVAEALAEALPETTVREPQPAVEPAVGIPEPEPAVEAEPEVAIQEPQPLFGIDAPAPEPEPVAESERKDMVPEPQPVVRLDVPAPEPEPVAEAERKDMVPEPQPVVRLAVPAPEPEPVAEAEREAVTPVAEPIAERAVEAATPEPEPVVETEPETSEPRRVFEVSLRKAAPASEPVTDERARREPEPVARQEAEPVTEASSPLFHADVRGSSDEELDIEREAIAFLRASAGTNTAAAPETERRPPSEAATVQPVEIVREEPSATWNGASTETMAPMTEEFADVAGLARTWDPAPDEEPAAEGENSEELVRQVAKILKVKRWDKKDSPFRGFDSPPGRF